MSNTPAPNGDGASMPAEIRAATEPLAKIAASDAAEYRTQKDGEPHFVRDEALDCDFRVQNGVRTTSGADGADAPTLDHVLYLGADACFFNKTGTMRAVKTGRSADQMNQLKDFTRVAGLHVKNQHLFWGFVVSNDFTAAKSVVPFARSALSSARTAEKTVEKARRAVGGALLFDRRDDGGGGGGDGGGGVKLQAKTAVDALPTAGVLRSRVRFELKLTPEKQTGKKTNPNASTTRTLVARIDGLVSHALHFLVKPHEEYYAADFDVSGLGPGYHTLEICLQDDYKFKTGFGQLHYVKASSDDVKLAVVRERWRPFACHIQFSCSKVTNVRTFVMGMTQAVPSLGSYNPITSRYGYDGFCFNGSNRVSRDNGMNMSAWSFGKKGSRPPMYKMSRGLFAGSAKARFSGFSHEGTGFKFRDFGPQWRGNTSGEYVLARRVVAEPEYVYGDGRVYRATTFWFDEERGCWRLYGILRFFSPQKIKSVLTKAFIEVPGPAEVQRTGHVPRTISYRGYVQDAVDGRWHLLDRMKNYPGQHTNKVWSINEAGTRFVASAGGLGYRKLGGPRTLQLFDEDDKALTAAENEDDFDSEAPVIAAFTDDVDGFGLDPDELDSDDEEDMEAAPVLRKHMLQIDELDALEKSIPWPTLESVAYDEKQVNLVVRVPSKEDTACDVIVLYGPKDCMTFEKEWAHRAKSSAKSVESVPTDVAVVLPRAESMVPGTTWYLRAVVRDSNLQAFSLDTYKFKV